MEEKRNSGSYAERAVNINIALRKTPDSSAPRRATSYRRPADAQPAGASPPETAMSTAMPSNTARPVVASSSDPVTQRRRNSKIILPPTTGAMGESIPAAPDVPRAPPSSYRDPYSRGVRVPARTSSGRARDPAIQLNPSRQQATIQTAADRLYNLRSPPYAPVEPLAGAVGRRGSQRGPSVPDRSPLQKLEGKLDDISKEERRARILEAELAAQEKAEAEARERRAREAAQNQQRVVSQPVATPDNTSGAPNRAGSSKRHVSMPTEKKHASPQITQWESDNGFIYDLNEPWDPSPPEGGAVQPAQQATRHKGQAVPRTTSLKGKEPVRGSPHSGSYSDRSSLPSQKDHKPASDAAGLGLVGVDDTSAGAEVTRAESKRVQGKRDSRGGIMAAQMDMSQESVDHKVAPRVVDIPPTKPRMPPVPKTTPVMPPVPQTNRKSVVFSESESELDFHDPEKKSRHRFSRHGEPERTYTPKAVLDEWKNAPVGALVADDLDLNAPVTANSGNKAWWEETKMARRRRSNSYAEPMYDGYADDTHLPTSFNPPLYLKCGPLLRYTGLRKDRSKPGQEREIWRGSVMIVTVDASSSYSKPPTLRLFKQPMDILPPPPEEVDHDQLDPSYIDPIEGQAKVSRTGKTLFVRPIDEIVEDVDLSRVENSTGLFSKTRSTANGSAKSTRIHKRDGEKLGKVRDFPGIRLHAERGVTFWRFNIEVELGTSQTRIAYKINQGPAIGFWVPAKGESMNIMFHSCNGFSASVDPDEFCGPDPMWRDVLNTHQTRPFHVMIGGGDQIYNDAAMRETTLFRQWTENRNPLHKHHQPFSEEMQNELEQFYLDRYAMWFSQGMFGLANSQIPMINIWDDHDIIDGFGSYPHHFMQTPVFTGVGAVAFKYYMLFQHQSVPAETEKTEPSWVLGKNPGPYIKERSRSVFMRLGRPVAFLGLDCRTERQRDEILTEDSYDIIFDRLEDEIVKGETKHLIVLLGVPIAYPRLNFLENILTSRLMDPIKALGRTGMLGNFVNKFDGGVEILDDLDDHWTAKHHKEERNWFIRELQHIASTKSVRVTILGGDVHLAAVGQFYSNKKLNVPKDKDHRYMPNVISSAIVNTPPPDMMADIINKRNKIHHLDSDTDEDMIPLFTHGVDGKKRNNNHLLPHRNWCSIREYKPGSTPSQTPSPPVTPDSHGAGRSFADFAPGQLVRRLSGQQTRPSARRQGPPVSYRNNPAYAAADDQQVGHHQLKSSFSPDRSEPERPAHPRRNSLSSLFRRRPSMDGDRPGTSESTTPRGRRSQSQDRPSNFHRRPSVLSRKSVKKQEFINLEGGLDICLNVEVSQHDPAGITTPYRLLVPALDYVETESGVEEKEPRKPRGFFRAFGKRKTTIGEDGNSISGSESGSELGEISSEDEEERKRKQYKVGPKVVIPGIGPRNGRGSASAPTTPAIPTPAMAPASAATGAAATTTVPRNDLLSSGFHINLARTAGPAQSDGAVHNPAARIQGRRSLDTGPNAGARAFAWDSVAAKRNASAPQHPQEMKTAAQATALPSRSASTRIQPTYSNSSHKSQLPATHPDDPLTVKRRPVGATGGQSPYGLTATQSQKRAKRESYPPHPAIVGAGPGSPYARDGQGLQPRQDTAGGDYFSSGGRDGQSHPAMAPRQVIDPEYTEKPVQRADYAAQPSRGGYDRTTATYPTYPQRNGSVGTANRYLGTGPPSDDDEDSFDSATEEETGFAEQQQQGEQMSQDSFVVPKQKKKWQIWKS